MRGYGNAGRKNVGFPCVKCFVLHIVGSDSAVELLGRSGGILVDSRSSESGTMGTVVSPALLQSRSKSDILVDSAAVSTGEMTGIPILQSSCRILLA